MPKPEIYPVKKLVRMDEQTIEAIDRFRAGEQPIPNQSEAIRRILREWLAGHGYLKD